MSQMQSLSLVGGVVPPSLVARLQSGEVRDPRSLSPASYHLVGTETVRDAASRAWGYLRGAWEAWQVHRGQEAPAAGTGAARDRWLLPLLRELGFGQVPVVSNGLKAGDQSYPVSHAWQHVPIHLLGPRVDLDRRNPGVAGAARAPQSMVQELLNRSDGHLWGILSNGLKWRLLRDSTSLAGSAYVEFDLEAIFDGELYAEWLLLYQMCHVSRFEIAQKEETGPADCWLEGWRGEAVDAGGRALDKLRVGVETALTELGSGFLAHPANGWLSHALRSGELTERDYHQGLLRLAYRLLFCFVAEDRDALLLPGDRDARERYHRYFSTARLRRLSWVRSGTSHGDLWQAQRLVLSALGGHGIPALAVPALGGLFDPDRRATVPTAAPDQSDLLLGAEISNADLLRAVRALGYVKGKNERTQRVDYRNLGAEELGSVYESLLELIPRVDLDERVFRLDAAAGNERKTTGSYYTPPELVSALLDSALEPVLDEATRGAADPEDAERRLLALTVCDPACGSGGFLVAAARRIAKRVAQWRSGEDEPTPEEVRHAMRDVVGRCVYGVDINDLAAELAKVSLWLEALEPGKALGFLEARIRVGNALLGATPALLNAGVPDAAFKELLGDDKRHAAAVRKRNSAESGGQGAMFFGERSDHTGDLARQRQALLQPVDDVEASRKQAERWAAYEASGDLHRQRLTADAWCAAFVWPLVPSAAMPPTTAVMHQIGQDPTAPDLHDTVSQVERLAADYRFFHWHLEFPEVFERDGHTPPGLEGWTGGFSCMLGNPPWEHVELKEQEFFAARDPEIALAAGARRKRLISQLPETDPALHAAYESEKRHIDGVRHLTATSGRFPLTGRGRVKTDSLFAELFCSLTGPHGHTGVIVPTGIATDATTQFFFKDTVTSQSLVALYDFENAAPIFEGVHRSFKFCLLTMSGRSKRTQAASFAFFLHHPGAIKATRFAMTPEEITLLNPNTGTCPIFRTRRDAEITLGIYRRVPVLIKEGDPDGNPWGISFMQGLFNMTSDSHLFHTREELEADGWTLDGNVFVKDAPPPQLRAGGDADVAPS